MQYSSSFIQHNQNTWYLPRINSGTLTAFVSQYKHFVTHYIMTIGSVSKYDMVWIISLVFMEATSQKRPSCQNHRALVRLVAMTTTWSCHLDSIMCQLCFRYWLMTLCGTCLTTLLSLCTWMTLSLSPKMRGIHCVAKVCSQVYVLPKGPIRPTWLPKKEVIGSVIHVVIYRQCYTTFEDCSCRGSQLKMSLSKREKSGHSVSPRCFRV